MMHTPDDSLGCRLIQLLSSSALDLCGQPDDPQSLKLNIMREKYRDLPISVVHQTCLNELRTFRNFKTVGSSKGRPMLSELNWLLNLPVLVLRRSELHGSLLCLTPPCAQLLRHHRLDIQSLRHSDCPSLQMQSAYQTWYLEVSNSPPLHAHADPTACTPPPTESVVDSPHPTAAILTHECSGTSQSS